MNDTQTYEKLVKRKTEGKLLAARIALILGYILFAVGGVILAILLADGHPALILLVALLDFCLWLLTHKLVQIEYEYTFIGGSFYLAKILGRSARRELFSEELSRAATVAPYSGQYKLEVEKRNIQRCISAVSSKNAENVWFILFEKESGGATLILFEADERSLKHLRQAAPRAVAREKLTNTSTEDVKDA